MKKSYCLSILLAGAIVELTLLGACTSTPSDSHDATPNAEEMLTKALLTKDDVPAGWYEVKVKPDTAADAIGRAVDFQGASDIGLSWVKLLQEVYLYTTNESATRAYQQLIGQGFPALGKAGSWEPVPEFQALSHADHVTIACLPVQINQESVQSCRSVAQYQTLIVVMYSNLLEDRWMTVEGFKKALSAMDRRAMEALSKP